MTELKKRDCWKFEGLLGWPPAVIGALLLIGYYAFCIVTMLLLLLLTTLIGVVVTIGARLFLIHLLTKPIAAQLGLLGSIIKSLFLGKDVDFDVVLKRQDAPELYALMEDIAHAVASLPADVITISMTSNAGILVKRLVGGRRRTTLNIGYDLLAAYSRAELGVILAHEMTHARYSSWGFMPWLRNGLRRMSKLAVLLEQQIENAARNKSKFHTASVLLAITNSVGARVSSLFGGCVRPEELRADMMSGMICGPGITRSALKRLAVLKVTSGRLSWWDRVAQFERGGSFSQWLRSELIPEEEEYAEIERKSLAMEWTNEYDTHPPLRERIAALAEGTEHICNDEPAIGLLQNPDDIAAILMNEIAKTVHDLQRKDTDRLRKSIKGQSVYDASMFRTFGVLIMIFCVIFAIYMLSTQRFSPYDRFVVCAIASGLFALGLLAAKMSRLRDPKLPVPHISHWFRTLTDHQARATGPGEWLDSVRDTLVAQIPSQASGKKKQIEYWEYKCREALRVCDYQTAFAAADMCIRLDRLNSMARLSRSIAAGYYRQFNIVQSDFDAISSQKIRPTSMLWASGWTHALTGHWDFAEARLLHACNLHPNDACVKDVLAYCQWHDGKGFEAIENQRAAIAMEPNEPAHRVMFALILLTSGKLHESQEHLEIARAKMPENRTVLLLSIRLNLLLGKIDIADEYIAKMEQIFPGSSALLDIANALAEVKLYDRSEKYYARAAEADYLPDAHIGLATSANIRKDNKSALSHIQSALDLRRKPPVSASSQYAALSGALSLLRLMREPIDGCKVWSIGLDLKDPDRGVSGIMFLVLAPDVDEAKDYARWVYSSMLPDGDFEAALQSCEPPHNVDDPQGAAIPGIQDYQILA